VGIAVGFAMGTPRLDWSKILRPFIPKIGFIMMRILHGFFQWQTAMLFPSKMAGF
jgi:hypothetical protein